MKNRTQELTGILQLLNDWDKTVEDADRIFKAIKEKLANKELLKRLTANEKTIVAQIASVYQRIIAELKLQRMSVKRQLLELTYSRDKMHAYLNQQQRRYPLINLNY